MKWLTIRRPRPGRCASGGGNRGPGGFAARPCNEHAVSRDTLSDEIDDPVRLRIIQLRRLTVRSQYDQPIERRLYPAADVLPKAALVERVVTPT